MVRRAPGRLSRRAGARVPDLHQPGLHRQCARRRAARASGADRRRAARQPAEPPGAQLERFRAGRLAAAAEPRRCRPGCATTTCPPPVDADDRANLYDAATGQLVQVGTNGMPRGGYEPDRNNIAPRAGLRLDDRSRGAHRPARRLRHLLQPGIARDGRGAVFQPAVLQPRRLLPHPGLAAADGRRTRSRRRSRSTSRRRRRRSSATCRRRGSSTGTSTCSGRSGTRARSRSRMSGRAATT